MIQKEIVQVLQVKTDIKELVNTTIDTTLTDKVAIEREIRWYFIANVGIEVLANYIEGENLVVINEVGK